MSTRRAAGIQYTIKVGLLVIWREKPSTGLLGNQSPAPSTLTWSRISFFSASIGPSNEDYIHSAPTPSARFRPRLGPLGKRLQLDEISAFSGIRSCQTGHRHRYLLRSDVATSRGFARFDVAHLRQATERAVPPLLRLLELRSARNRDDFSVMIASIPRTRSVSCRP